MTAQAESVTTLASRRVAKTVTRSKPMRDAKYPNGLDAAMSRAGIGPTELGRRVDEPKQNIERWQKGQRRLNPDKAMLLAPHLGVTPEDLLLIKVGKTPKLAKASVTSVPLISWVSAGRLAGSDIPPNVRVERRLPVADLGRGSWIALRVQGDSMDRIAPDDSVIFVDVSDKRLVEDRFYVFITEGGDSTFKRYRGGAAPRLQPYSTNPDHETIPAGDDLRVVGRVRRAVVEL